MVRRVALRITAQVSAVLLFGILLGSLLSWHKLYSILEGPVTPSYWIYGASTDLTSGSLINEVDNPLRTEPREISKDDSEVVMADSVSQEQFRALKLKQKRPSPSLGLSASSFFHVLEGGARVEGVLLMMGVDLERWGWRKMHDNKYTSGQIVFIPINSSQGCYWCPQDDLQDPATSCLEGRPRLATFEHISDAAPRVSAQFLQMYMHLRPYSVPLWQTGSKQYEARYKEYFLSCCIHPGKVVPTGVPGQLVTVLKSSVAVQVNSMPKLMLKDRDFACARFDVGPPPNAHRLLDMVTYYTDVLEFSAFFIYEMSLSSHKTLLDVINEERGLQDLVMQGKLIVVDLRDALVRSYGPLYQQALAFSHNAGTSMFLHDCIMRVRSNGGRWVLPLDLGDILLMAPAVRTGWARFAQEQTKEFPRDSFIALEFPEVEVVSGTETTSLFCSKIGQGFSTQGLDLSSVFGRFSPGNSVRRRQRRYALRVDGPTFPLQFFNVAIADETLLASYDFEVQQIDFSDAHYRRYVDCALKPTSTETHVGGLEAFPYDWFG